MKKYLRLLMLLCPTVFLFGQQSVYGQNNVENKMVEDDDSYEEPLEPIPAPVGVQRHVLRENGKFGFANDNNEVVLKPQFDYVIQYPEGYSGVSKDGKWGMVDKDGKLIIPVKFSEWPGGGVCDGRVKVEINGRTGFIDTAGNLVVPAKYDWAEDFNERMAIVESNGKMGFIDITGKLVIPCRYDNVESFQDGSALVNADDKYMLIDKNGAMLFGTTFDEAESYRNGVVKVRRGNDRYYIDRQGKCYPDRRSAFKAAGK